jgi:UDP-N-acetylmuramoyl-tripeptide--D-alanyl-D-alanine ligase
MEAALKNFANVESDNKVAMLGDMLELGSESVAEHVRIAEMAISLGLKRVCFVGAEFAKALESISTDDSVVAFATSAELTEWLKETGLSDAVILIKGSRGTRMEKTMEAL